MKKESEILRFREYFRKIDRKSVYKWQKDDVGRLYPIYSLYFTEFIDRVCSSDSIDYHYIDTLKKYNVPLNFEISDYIEKSNEELLNAILSYFVFQEYSQEGIWRFAVEFKVFYKILLRMTELHKKNELHKSSSY
ncbi:MAG TPA: hypothetical protein DHN33_08240 [Eubacteriaceae bacterium]|nr:hypothetical protein [Eubacteriaceae bacterium]